MIVIDQRFPGVLINKRSNACGPDVLMQPFISVFPEGGSLVNVVDPGFLWRSPVASLLCFGADNMKHHQAADLQSRPIIINQIASLPPIDQVVPGVAFIQMTSVAISDPEWRKIYLEEVPEHYILMDLGNQTNN